MRNIILGIIVGLVVGGLVTWSYLKHHEDKPAEKKEESKEPKRVQQSTNGETFLKLSKEDQEHAGLKIGTVEAVEMTPEVKGFGRVLDPSPLAMQLVDLSSAQAALEASHKELERLKVLHAQNQNVSTRVLEAAEATAKRDQLLLQAAQARLKLAWGKIAERKDLPALVDSLTSLKASVVRIDLSLGSSVTALPTGARVAPVGAEQNLVETEFIGISTTADPQVQGQGFLFLAQTNSLIPGATVTGYLKIPGSPKQGVSVPNTALIRHEGEVFVYVQTSDDTFQREEVKLETPLPNGWLVSDDLKAGQKIVVTGAQQLLSEELKSRGEE